MTTYEAWIVYDENGRPVATAREERTAWTLAWAELSEGYGFYEWRDLYISLGWKCFRVVPEEGQT